MEVIPDLRCRIGGSRVLVISAGVTTLLPLVLEENLSPFLWELESVFKP